MLDKKITKSHGSRPRRITKKRLVSDIQTSLKSEGLVVNDIVIDIIITNVFKLIRDYVVDGRKVILPTIGTIFATFRIKSKKPSDKPEDCLVPLIKVKQIDKDIKSRLIETIKEDESLWR